MIYIERIITLEGIDEIVDFLFTILTKHSTISLVGQIGSGKTTLVQGLIAKLLPQITHVESPTFTLLNSYEGKSKLLGGMCEINHYDLYKLQNSYSIKHLDLESRLGNSICIIEWANKLGHLLDSLPLDTIYVELEYVDELSRKIKIRHYVPKSKSTTSKENSTPDIMN